jgi:hypothetical protein
VIKLSSSRSRQYSGSPENMNGWRDLELSLELGRNSSFDELLQGCRWNRDKLFHVLGWEKACMHLYRRPGVIQILDKFDF